MLLGAIYLVIPTAYLSSGDRDNFIKTFRDLFTSYWINKLNNLIMAPAADAAKLVITNLAATKQVSDQALPLKRMQKKCTANSPRLLLTSLPKRNKQPQCPLRSPSLPLKWPSSSALISRHRGACLAHYGATKGKLGKIYHLTTLSRKQTTKKGCQLWHLDKKDSDLSDFHSLPWWRWPASKKLHDSTEPYLFLISWIRCFLPRPLWVSNHIPSAHPPRIQLTHSSF